MNFKLSLNSGWIQRQKRKEIFSKIFNVSWKLFCLTPVIIVFTNLIVWFVRIIDLNQFNGFWNNLFLTINESFNWQPVYVLLWIITIGNLALFVISTIQQAKTNDKMLWVNVGLLIIDLIFIKLMTLNITFIIAKAIFEVVVQFIIWFLQIAKLQKELNKLHNYK